MSIPALPHPQFLSRDEANGVHLPSGGWAPKGPYFYALFQLPATSIPRTYSPAGST
jgi:hypothetical protein